MKNFTAKLSLATLLLTCAYQPTQANPLDALKEKVIKTTHALTASVQEVTSTIDNPFNAPEMQKSLDESSRMYSEILNPGLTETKEQRSFTNGLFLGAMEGSAVAGAYSYGIGRFYNNPGMRRFGKWWFGLAGIEFAACVAYNHVTSNK